MKTLALCFGLTICGSLQAQHAGDGTLRLATWNLAWLIAPDTLQQLSGSCRASINSVAPAARALPCDVARTLRRGAADFAALARHARALDADVIAIQEVDGPAAARLVFTAHEFCFSGARALQNTGFAIRRGVPFRCEPDYRDLSLGDSLRRGAVVTLYPGSARELRLMGVHLKSGCARAPMDNGASACTRLARQVPLLERWIDAQAEAGRRFAVLGDFNRDFGAERGGPRGASGAQRNIWAELDDGAPLGLMLRNAAAGETFRNCVRGQNHNGYIDYIVLGGPLAKLLIPKSFRQHSYESRLAAQRLLSDHCPVSVDLRIG